jgi:hypothetical protein
MSKAKLYNYVGSEEIKLSIINFGIGTVIRSISDIRHWIDDTCDRKTISSNLVIATFVIDMHGELRLADRYSEHIACAGREPVLSAGEIFISWNKKYFEVSEITNQSTGYCPKIESWEHVEIALNKISINHPSCFTSEFIFRHCSSCLQINIIKDNFFICSVCNSNLSHEWNFK